MTQRTDMSMRGLEGDILLGKSSTGYRATSFSGTLLAPQEPLHDLCAETDILWPQFPGTKKSHGLNYPALGLAQLN